MGISNTKNVNVRKQDNVQNAGLPSTPISTPQTSRKNEFDPRSPSTNISRTPLELETSFTIEENEIESGEVFYSPMKGDLLKCSIDPRSPTTEFYRTPILLNSSKNNLLLNSSDDIIETFNSPVAPKTKVLESDPRSPTNEFLRTPIVVPDTPNSKLIKIIHNKNLEKVIQSEIGTTPTLKKDKNGPKLLESSPVRKRNDSYKRKSFVGLLETNIDFTETDIDAVLKEKCRIRDNDNKEELDFENNLTEKNIKNITENNIADFETKNDQAEILPNDKNLKEKHEQALEKEYNFDLNNVDLIANDSKEIINETVEEKCANPNEVLLDEDIKNQETEISLEISQTKLAPLTPRKKSEQPKRVLDTKSGLVTPPLVNITADVKELDKKLTNLIYEDQDIVVCPRIVQLKDVLERSPLRNRNTNDYESKKSAQKLKVSDKPRKSDFVVSKIPIFKSTKNKIQCENTPPRNMERKSRIAKKSQWDNKDVTLYL